MDNIYYLDVHFVPRNGFQYFILGTFDVQSEIVDVGSAHGKQNWIERETLNSIDARFSILVIAEGNIYCFNCFKDWTESIIWAIEKNLDRFLGYDCIIWIIEYVICNRYVIWRRP